MEQYEVVFYDDNEETILDRQRVNKGEKVTYKGTQTEKEEDNKKYILVGWIGEEKMAEVTEDLKLVAIYEAIVSENRAEQDEEMAYYEAVLQSAENTTLSGTVKSGLRLSEHQIAIMKSGRTPQDIVAEVLAKGSVELVNTSKSEREDQDNEQDLDDYEK